MGSDSERDRKMVGVRVNRGKGSKGCLSGAETLGVAEGDVGKTNTHFHTARPTQEHRRAQERGLPGKGPRCEQREYIITMSSRLLGEVLSG